MAHRQTVRSARRAHGAAGGLPGTIGRSEVVVSSGVALVDPDPSNGSAATLWIDDVPQSHVDLADPTALSFEYVRQMGDVIDIVFPAGRAIDVLHLGGGALTLPRYVATTRRGSSQRVAEIDAALVELVRTELPIDPADRIRVSTTDGRALLGRTPPGSQDAVVVDVFSAGRLPPAYTSTEFFDLAAHALRPAGMVIMNVADGKPLAFSRSLAATARSTFQTVAMLAEPSIWRGRRFGNLILVATNAELPLDALRRRLAGGVFPARLLAGNDLAELVGDAPVRTDAQDAPTPQPPAHVFEQLRRSTGAADG